MSVEERCPRIIGKCVGWTEEEAEEDEKEEDGHDWKILGLF